MRVQIKSRHAMQCSTKSLKACSLKAMLSLTAVLLEIMARMSGESSLSTGGGSSKLQVSHGTALLMPAVLTGRRASG